MIRPTGSQSSDINTFVGLVEGEGGIEFNGISTLRECVHEVDVYVAPDEDGFDDVRGVEGILSITRHAGPHATTLLQEQMLHNVDQISVSDRRGYRLPEDADVVQQDITLLEEFPTLQQHDHVRFTESLAHLQIPRN